MNPSNVTAERLAIALSNSRSERQASRAILAPPDSCTIRTSANLSLAVCKLLQLGRLPLALCDQTYVCILRLTGATARHHAVLRTLLETSFRQASLR